MNRREFTRVASLAACGMLGLGMSPAAHAAQQPNTLTPEEIAQGWILLFDGSTQFGWAPRGSARWVVSGGTLIPVPGSGRGVLSTTTEFPNYRLHVEFWVDDVANSGVFLRCPTEGDITQGNAYEVNIYDQHPTWPTGSINDVARAAERRSTSGRWNSYDIIADGTRLVVNLNGHTVLNTKDSRYARGTVGLQYNGQGEVRFRNVKLQPLGLKSLFNGKDLSGWKEHPGRASVYSVTPEGYLNVKNGPGDLQTAETYGDFVLQLDCISNGTHLNSGIFFRAEPGQYQIGYESQIRNQWEGNDRSKPVDFGTGGVYRRQPARMVNATDREWFTKTLVAHGRHIAVWVNGVQVSDWTDPREPNNNARQGYRAAAGAISIQGHDPTTDLSFRNLRVAEMPAVRK